MIYLVKAETNYGCQDLGESGTTYCTMYTTYERMQRYLSEKRRVTTYTCEYYDECYVGTSITTFTFEGTTDIVPDDIDAHDYDDDVCGHNYWYTCCYDDLMHTCAEPNSYAAKMIARNDAYLDTSEPAVEPEDNCQLELTLFQGCCAFGDGIPF